MLAALAGEEVIEILDGRVRVIPRWVERCRFLLGAATLRIEVIAISGAAAAATRASVLVTAGPRPYAALLPSVPPKQDVLIAFRPATRDWVAGLVAQLLSAPPTPSRLPLARTMVDLARILGVSADTPAHSVHESWRLNRPEELLVEERVPDAPRAIANPQVTIQILGGNGGDGRRTRVLISIADNSVAEWLLDGDLLRWRPLATDDVVLRLDELAGLDGAPPGREELELPSVTVPRAALSRLISSGKAPVGEGEEALPEALGGLIENSAVRWTLVEATAGIESERRQARVLVLVSSSDTWLVTDRSGTLVAQPGGSVALRAAIVGCLTPLHDSVAHGSLAVSGTNSAR